MLKQITISVSLIGIVNALIAQAIIFNESFESGLGKFSFEGTTVWQANDSIKYANSLGIFNPYKSNEKNSLTITDSLDFSSYSGVILEFYHIAKVEIADKAIIQVSTDGGTIWKTLDTSYYTGSGILLFDTTFFDGSYAEWELNQNITPDSTWWKKETFNLTAFTGSGFNNIKIRFKLISDDVFSWYGWLIDEVNIFATLSGEFDPPVITHTPLMNTGSTDSVTVTANITDVSAIFSADVFYRVNGNAWIGPNTMVNTQGNDYEYTIPGNTQGSKVDYYIAAKDSSEYGSTSFHPANAPTIYHSFEVVNSIFSFPYYENFETVTATEWTHKADLNTGNTGVQPFDYWELGSPSKFNFDSAYSGNKAYVTDLYNSYGENSRSSLMSPLFYVSEVKVPVLSFYHQFNTDFNSGGRVDYTLNDGFTWDVLGVIGSNKGTSWYNYYSIPSASFLTARPGWTGNSYFTWTKSSYDISEFALPGLFIRFRFVFTSDYSSFSNDGWIIDDVRITDLSDSAGILSEYDFLFLWQNYPNPSINSTKIIYSIPQPGDVTINIFDITGKLSFQSHIANQSMGGHIETIDLSSFSNGIYLYQLQFGEKIISKKMTVLK